MQESANFNRRDQIAQLDRVDRTILHLLQVDGRLSNARLAAQVNLSESACSRRVAALEQRGYLQDYVGLVDQAMAGYPDNVFVRITLHSQQQADLAAFEAEAAQLPEVMECYLMSGDADYLLRVIVADARDYERVHSQFLTRLPGVARVHSSLRYALWRKKLKCPYALLNGRSFGHARSTSSQLLCASVNAVSGVSTAPANDWRTSSGVGRSGCCSNSASTA